MLRALKQSIRIPRTPTSCLHSIRQASSSTSVPDVPEPTTQGRRRRKLYSQGLSLPPGTSYPQVTDPNPVLDAWDYGGDNVIFDDPTSPALFNDKSLDKSIVFLNENSPFPYVSAKDAQELVPKPQIAPREQHTYVLLRKRVVHQTGKGKMSSMYYGVVVGNGKGVVGFGDAKSEDPATGTRKATANALKNCDAVELFEGRTIWSDMRIKFGSTELHLRPRPRGFGLMCNPYVHQVCKAAGIKDISAKVHGSRNPMAVIKATLMLLHSGGAPLGMGDGIGGKGRREDKKVGIKSLATIERERGREFKDGGAWI